MEPSTGCHDGSCQSPTLNALIFGLAVGRQALTSQMARGRSDLGELQEKQREEVGFPRTVPAQCSEESEVPPKSSKTPKNIPESIWLRIRIPCFFPRPHPIHFYILVFTILITALFFFFQSFSGPFPTCLGLFPGFSLTSLSIWVLE